MQGLPRRRNRRNPLGRLGLSVPLESNELYFVAAPSRTRPRVRVQSLAISYLGFFSPGRLASPCCFFESINCPR